MIVVLDTNVFWNKFRFQDASMRILIEHVRTAGFSLVVPEVVVLETVNQVREKISAAAKANNDRIQKLRRETGASIASLISEDDIDREVAKYDQFLRNLLREAAADVPMIPNVSHEAIVRRDLLRQKPFSASGKGYRDALIWETILGVAKTRPESIAFVSSNTDDFADDAKENLHPDLVADLTSAGLPADKVTLFLSLASFVKSALIPNLPSPVQTIAKFMQVAHPTFNLGDALCEEFSTQLLGYELEHYQLGKPSEFESITISLVEHAYDVEIHDERELPSSERVLEVTAKVECEFDTFIFKPDLWCMGEDEAPFVWDSDWNDHYAAASFSGTIKVNAFVTLDMEGGRVSSIEVIEVEALDSTSD